MKKDFLKKLDSELKSTEISDPIVQVGDPILRQTAKEVDLSLIDGVGLANDIQYMKSVLEQESYDGVALAAPQVGISKRIFIVAGRVFSRDEDETEPEAVAYINPVIIKHSSKQLPMDEGCLSVRMVYGTVKRYTNVTISYYDEKGVKHERGAGGLLAHIFQHEIDHLDGILFIDKTQSQETLSGKDRKEYLRKRQLHQEELQEESRSRTDSK